MPKVMSTKGCTPFSSDGGIFGVKLNDVMARPSQRHIPTIVKEIIIRLHGIAMYHEDIFRKSPHPQEIKAMQDLVDRGDSVRGLLVAMKPHVLSSLLKSYLAQLPDPLFTDSLYESLISNSENVMRLSKIIQNQLSTHHKKLAYVIVLMLKNVLENSRNKVSIDELSLIFGPVTIRPAQETCKSMMQIPKRVNVFSKFMEHFDFIFQERPTKMTIIHRMARSEFTAQKYKSTEMQKKLTRVIDLVLVPLTYAYDVSTNIALLKEDEEISKRIDILADQILVLYCNQLKSVTDHRLIETSTTENFPSINMIRYKTLVESGSESLRGLRTTVEDRVVIHDDINEGGHIRCPYINVSFYAVFDGHGGSEAAEIASKLAMKQITSNIDFLKGDIMGSLRNGLITLDHDIVKASIEEGWDSGSTAMICMIVGEVLYVANLGDSDAIIAYRIDVCGRDGPRIGVLPLSVKHKPDLPVEKERINSVGGTVLRGRIFGRLAVSRGLGDSAFKIPKAKVNYVGNEPFVGSFELKESYRFLVVACDGLWDVLSYMDVVEYVQDHLEEGQSPEVVAKQLAQHAIDRGSKDNVTAIIVKFNWVPFKEDHVDTVGG